MSKRKWPKMTKRQRGMEKLRRTIARKEMAPRLESMSDNELASHLRAAKDVMLGSPAWKELRAKVLAKYGAKCMRCGCQSTKPGRIVVDHVKPRRYYPELAMDENNLQVLCNRCNRDKGNNLTDYRPSDERKAA
jgi:hypothetical protein